VEGGKEGAILNTGSFSLQRTVFSLTAVFSPVRSVCSHEEFFVENKKEKELNTPLN
jgi:hypothetical protein